MKGLDKIFYDQSIADRFCHQQISFMVIGEDLKMLDRQVNQASEALAKIGIVHVREDINLEKTFWAQLPANFAFLARMKLTIVDNTAALASLHNCPTGNQFNPWGRAVTYGISYSYGSEKIVCNIAIIKDQEALLRRLGPYLEGGLYYEVFERQEPFQLVQGQITALSLQSFDDAEYTKNHFPKEKKLIEQFEYDLNSMRAVKAAIVLVAGNVMQNLGEGLKIFAVDNFAELVNLKYYQHLVTYMTGRMSEINGVSIFTINTNELALLKEKEISQNWIKDIATSFIFPSEISVVGLDKILGLEPAELRKLSAMTVSSRMFLIKAR